MPGICGGTLWGKESPAGFSGRGRENRRRGIPCVRLLRLGFYLFFFQGLEPEWIVVLHMAFWNIAREHGAEGWAFAWGQSGHVDVNGQEDGHDAGAAKMNKDAPLQNFPCEFSFQVQGFGATL